MYIYFCAVMNVYNPADREDTLASKMADVNSYLKIFNRMKSLPETNIINAINCSKILI